MHIYTNWAQPALFATLFSLAAANIISDQFEHFLPINFSYSAFAHSSDMVITLTTALGQLGSGSVQQRDKGAPAVTDAALNLNMQGITLCKKKKNHKVAGKKKTFLTIVYSWNLKCFPTALQHYCVSISVWVGFPFQHGMSAVACSSVIKLIYFAQATF